MHWPHEATKYPTFLHAFGTDIGALLLQTPVVYVRKLFVYVKVLFEAQTFFSKKNSNFFVDQLVKSTV